MTILRSAVKIVFFSVVLAAITLVTGCSRPAGLYNDSAQLPDELVKVQELVDSGKGQKAAKIATKWLKDNELSQHRELGLKLQADALYLGGQYYKSYLAYEKLLNEYGATTYFSYAIEREIDIAQRFLAGQRRPFLGLFRVTARSEALKMLDDIDARWPGSAAGAQAVMLRGDHYFDKEKYFEAEQEYHRVLVSYARSSHYPRAMFLEAESMMRQYEGIYYDTNCLDGARELFLVYKSRFPELAAQNNVDQKIAWIVEEKVKKEFEIADYYSRTGKTPQAVLYWQSVIEMSPESEYAQKALERIQKSGQSS